MHEIQKITGRGYKARVASSVGRLEISYKISTITGTLPVVSSCSPYMTAVSVRHQLEKTGLSQNLAARTILHHDSCLSVPFLIVFLFPDIFFFTTTIHENLF